MSIFIRSKKFWILMNHLVRNKLCQSESMKNGRKSDKRRIACCESHLYGRSYSRLIYDWKYTHLLLCKSPFPCFKVEIKLKVGQKKRPVSHENSKESFFLPLYEVQQSNHLPRLYQYDLERSQTKFQLTMICIIEMLGGQDTVP